MSFKISLLLPPILALPILALPQLSFPESIEVLQTGAILKEDAPSTRGGWFALYQDTVEPGSFSLKRVTIETEAYFDPASNSEEEKTDKAKWNGVTLKASPIRGLGGKSESQVEPVILVRKKDLKEGKVLTAFPGAGSQEDRSPGSFAPLETISLTLHERMEYILELRNRPGACLELKHASDLADASSNNREKNLKEYNLPANYDWSLNDSLFQNTDFCRNEVRYYPTLVWAGDLDRDHRLDLIIDIERDSTYTRALFLSSLADSGKYVKLVGEFTKPSGC